MSRGNDLALKPRLNEGAANSRTDFDSRDARCARALCGAKRGQGMRQVGGAGRAPSQISARRAAGAGHRSLAVPESSDRADVDRTAEAETRGGDGACENPGHLYAVRRDQPVEVDPCKASADARNSTSSAAGAMDSPRPAAGPPTNRALPSSGGTVCIKPAHRPGHAVHPRLPRPRRPHQHWRPRHFRTHLRRGDGGRAAPHNRSRFSPGRSYSPAPVLPIGGSVRPVRITTAGAAPSDTGGNVS